MNGPRPSSRPPVVPRLRVRTPDGRECVFEHPFHVGRGADCDVQVDDAHVSRKHVVVSFEDGRWRVRDLQSINGVFINGDRVETAPIDQRASLRLGGLDGPLLTLELEPPAKPTIPRSVVPHTQPVGDSKAMMAKYFGREPRDGQDGPQTIMIRRTFHEIQKRQKRRYGWIVAVVLLAGVGAGGYAYRAHRQMVRQQAAAEELFYLMKSQDVKIAGMEALLATSGTQGRNQLAQYLDNRREMERAYDKFLSTLNVYGRGLSEQERLILKVTRTFGECELVVPSDYLTEVATYIQKWQATGRYERAVNLARERGYIKTIATEFIGQNLPPQFFYLAMQESDFDPFRSGPPTRMGIAKGMWQFIPETGSRYGLSIGPLSGVPGPDPADERSQWEKATKAAARYIKDIYSTDAQASGLLVMASYNWGEQRIIKLLRRMPANPRERNFWKLLEHHRDQVPKETYDYVFYIVSAAVIGENPRLFGFPFDSPLLSATK